MRIARRAGDTAPPWALLSYLLRYPGTEVAAAGPELAAEVAALPGGPIRSSLELFMAAWTDDQTALAARYVETFDLRRRATLELTYYEHGDTRERGMALLRLKQLYRAAGLPMDAPELPDHLTVMLAFAALAEEGHGAAVLGRHRPAIELLRLSLHDSRSPYAHVLDAIAALLAPVTAAERSEVARLARE
jgi:nitrate reductase delta subunit